MRNVVILGSTGSIGTQALDVLSGASDGVIPAEAGIQDQFRVVGLTAHTNETLLREQAAAFGVSNERAIAHANAEQLRELASLPEADIVLNAVLGFAALPGTLAALESGKRLALANKESLIAAGPIVAKARANGGGEIIPVDSEHSAIYQCLRAGRTSEVRRIVLTASGGPFREWPNDKLADVTVQDALAHPTWSMGEKITVDSSTLMNKGFEVIEAHELFDVPFEKIDVLVHPQSVVHSMVEFQDGATIAQLSMPDMRLPIGLALGVPERFPHPYGAVDWTKVSALTFQEPDRRTFRCLDLAYAAGRAGGGAPALLNGANEVVVAAFLRGEVSWLAIADTLEDVLQGGVGPVDELGDVLEADRVGREQAQRVIERKSLV